MKEEILAANLKEFDTRLEYYKNLQKRRLSLIQTAKEQRKSQKEEEKNVTCSEPEPE